MLWPAQTADGLSKCTRCAWCIALCRQLDMQLNVLFCRSDGRWQHAMRRPENTFHCICTLGPVAKCNWLVRMLWMLDHHFTCAPSVPPRSGHITSRDILSARDSSRSQHLIPSRHVIPSRHPVIPSSCHVIPSRHHVTSSRHVITSRHHVTSSRYVITSRPVTSYGHVTRPNSETCSSALHSTFHFWRKSHRIDTFLTLSSSKVEEVSPDCCAVDHVKLQNWGSLAK